MFGKTPKVENPDPIPTRTSDTGLESEKARREQIQEELKKNYSRRKTILAGAFNPTAAESAGSNGKTTILGG